MLDRLQRHALPLALALAALLALPIAGLPLFNDDLMHLMVIEDWLGDPSVTLPALRGAVDPLGLPNPFGFVSGDVEANAAFIADGQLPWWTATELKLNFWRPLSSALMVLDHSVLGRAPLGHHLHSIAWYLALVAGAWAVLRRALPGSLAALALVLFAVDDAHWLPTAWVANRNALVAAVPGLFGVAAHLRWREGGWAPGRLLSPLLMAIALTGGEAALGAFAYLAAYEGLAAPGGRGERLRALAPAVAVGGVWAFFYKLWGFGSAGSGLYLDPTRETGAYLLAASSRAPALIGSALGGLPSDLWFFAPPVRPALAGFGFVTMVLAFGLGRRLWPTLDPEARRGLTWLAGGGLLSLAPVLATFPLDRLLLLPSLGSAALVAAVLSYCWRLLRGWATSSGNQRLQGLFALPVIAVHLVLAPLVWLGMSWTFHRLSGVAAEAVASVELDPARTSEQYVITLASSDPALAIYLPMQAVVDGLPMPKAWHTLSMARGDHAITRTAPDAFELAPVEGAMTASAFEALYRSPDLAFAPGDVIESAPLTVEILEVEGGLPARARFSFDGLALEDPSLALLEWRDGALRQAPMPAVGETRTLVWSPGITGM